MKKRMLCLLLCVVCLIGYATSALAVLDLSALKKKTLTTGDETFDFWSSEKYSAYAEWKTKGSDLYFHPKMENKSDCETVDAFDLALYCTNVYDEPIYPDDKYTDYIRYYTLEKKFKAGKSGYADYCILKGCKSARNVYVALVRYHVEDGYTVNLGDSSVSGDDPLTKYKWLGWDVD